VAEIALRRQSLPLGGLQLDRRRGDRGQIGIVEVSKSGIAANLDVSIANTVVTGLGRKGELR
jgi:hypothetical protein